MKVKELMALLAAHDPEMEVFHQSVSSWDSGTDPLDPIEQIEIRTIGEDKEDQSLWEDGERETPLINRRKALLFVESY